MTTLCRSDWIEANAAQELRNAHINPFKLPTTSFEKMMLAGTSASTCDSRFFSQTSLRTINQDLET
jgi:hypothetical protein